MDTGSKSPAASPTKDAGSTLPAACSSSTVSQLMSTPASSVPVDGVRHGCNRKAPLEEIGIDLLESKRARDSVDVFHKMVKDLEYQHAFERNNLARKIIMGMEQVPLGTMSSMVNYEYGLMSSSGLCYQPLIKGEYGANNRFALNGLEKNVGFEADRSRKVPPTSQSSVLLENNSVDMIQRLEKTSARLQAMSSMKNYETSLVGVISSTDQSDLGRAKSSEFELLRSTVNQSTSNGIQALSFMEATNSGSSRRNLKRKAVSIGETSRRRSTSVGPGNNNARVAKGLRTEEENQMVTMVNEQDKKLHDCKEKWMEIVNALAGTNAMHECEETWNSHLNPDNKIRAGSSVTAHHKKEVIKGQWTEEETQLLRKIVNQHETNQEDKDKWKEISKALPGRSAKQCKERWNNHLNPDITKDTFSLDEEKALIAAHMELGHKWAEISRTRMPGRAENTIKNRWNAAYRKVFERRKLPVSLLENYIRDLGPRSKLIRPSATKASQKSPAPAQTYADANSPTLLADTRTNGNTLPVLKPRPSETSHTGRFSFLPVQIVGRYLQPLLHATTSQSELLLPEKDTNAMTNQQPEPAPDIQTPPTCVGLIHNYTSPSYVDDWLQKDGNECSALNNQILEAEPDIEPPPTCMGVYSSFVDLTDNYFSNEEKVFLEETSRSYEVHPPPSLFSRSPVERCTAIPNQVPGATSSQSELIARSHIDDWLHIDGNDYSALPGQVEDHSLPMPAPVPAPEIHYTRFDHGNEQYMDALTEYIKEGNNWSLDDMTEEELERLAMCFEV